MPLDPLKVVSPPQLTVFLDTKAGAIREVREIACGLEAYFEDRWNILDVLGLAWLAGGFLVRWIDSTSPWGRTLYSLGAPVVFSRLLFFAQILPFQGPMIQVSADMFLYCSSEHSQYPMIIFTVSYYRCGNAE